MTSLITGNGGNLGEDILIHIWEYIPFFVIANGITFAKISRVAYKRFHRLYANILAVYRETAESEFPYRLDVDSIDILRQLSKISLACNRTSRYACSCQEEMLYLEWCILFAIVLKLKDIWTILMDRTCFLGVL